MNTARTPRLRQASVLAAAGLAALVVGITGCGGDDTASAEPPAQSTAMDTSMGETSAPAEGNIVETAVAAGLIFERPTGVSKGRYTTPGGAQAQLSHAAVQYAPYRAGETTTSPSPASRPDMAGHGDDRVKTHQRRELVVLVTPKVVARVARAADEAAGQ